MSNRDGGMKGFYASACKRPQQTFEESGFRPASRPQQTYEESGFYTSVKFSEWTVPQITGLRSSIQRPAEMADASNTDDPSCNRTPRGKQNDSKQQRKCTSVRTDDRCKHLDRHRQCGRCRQTDRNRQCGRCAQQTKIRAPIEPPIQLDQVQ